MVVICIKIVYFTCINSETDKTVLRCQEDIFLLGAANILNF